VCCGEQCGSMQDGAIAAKSRHEIYFLMQRSLRFILFCTRGRIDWEVKCLMYVCCCGVFEDDVCAGVGLMYVLCILDDRLVDVRGAVLLRN
jgi:hypothetical protein